MHSKRKRRKLKSLIEFWAQMDARLKACPMFNGYALNIAIVKRADEIRRDFNNRKHGRGRPRNRNIEQ